MIQRYSVYTKMANGLQFMAEADINEGQWCKYEDVKALEEENEKLKKEIEGLYEDLAGESP